MGGPRFVRRAGPVPLHHQVYLDLRAALDNGTYRPGDRLPPERELAASYGCSLITIRRALDELARELRIDRVPGRGTHVLRRRIDRNLSDTNSFGQEMQRLGLVPATRVISARQEPAAEHVAACLELQPGAPTLYVERLRLASAEPLLLEMVHLPADRFPGLLASDLERQSLYDLMTERYDVGIATTRETLEPVLLKSREARLLGQEARMPALLVEGIAFSGDGVPVEFSRTYVRGDRTRYYVERVVVREGARAADHHAPPADSRVSSFAGAR